MAKAHRCSSNHLRIINCYENNLWKTFLRSGQRNYNSFYQNCQNSNALCIKTYKKLKTAKDKTKKVVPKTNPVAIAKPTDTG